MEFFNNNENNQIKKSAIYVVATPIGNMEDITIRALKTLNNVDFILAEDTRVAIKLLNFYKIKKPLYSYHSHSSENKINKYIENILKGNSAAIISDAGTPCISDPGVSIISKGEFCMIIDNRKSKECKSNAENNLCKESNYDN